MRGVCRECGCTDDDACVLEDLREMFPLAPVVTCHWVELDLCSACGEPPLQEPADPGNPVLQAADSFNAAQDPSPLLYDAYGAPVAWRRP